jgi:hypothetical protein
LPCWVPSLLADIVVFHDPVGRTFSPVQLHADNEAIFIPSDVKTSILQSPGVKRINAWARPVRLNQTGSKVAIILLKVAGLRPGKFQNRELTIQP